MLYCVYSFSHRIDTMSNIAYRYIISLYKYKYTTQIQLCYIKNLNAFISKKKKMEKNVHNLL